MDNVKSAALDLLETVDLLLLRQILKAPRGTHKEIIYLEGPGPSCASYATYPALVVVAPILLVNHSLCEEVLREHRHRSRKFHT